MPILSRVAKGVAKRLKPRKRKATKKFTTPPSYLVNDIMEKQDVGKKEAEQKAMRFLDRTAKLMEGKEASPSVLNAAKFRLTQERWIPDHLDFKKGGKIMPKKMSRVGLSPAEESRSGTMSEAKRRRYAGGGKMQQGYDARKDEQLGMTRGKEAGKKMSMKGRRDVAKATRKPRGTYGFKKGGPIGVGAAKRGWGATGKH